MTKNQRLKWYFTILSFLVGSIAFAAEHSTLDIKQLKNSSGVISFEFKVTPLKNHHLTKEAPWKLTIENGKDLFATDEKGLFIAKGLDEKVSGFMIATTKPVTASSKGIFTYTLKAFICTDDKSNCYPDTFKGEFSWKS